MGKVKRGRKIRKGHYEGYTWICAECGREWASMNVARDCTHVNEIMCYYHDDVIKPLNLENYLVRGK